MKRARFLIALLMLPLLAGCQPHGRETCEAPGDNPIRYELTAMDTFMTMTIYNQPGDVRRGVSDRPPSCSRSWRACCP